MAREAEPNASAQKIAKHTGIPDTTVRRCLDELKPLTQPLAESSFINGVDGVDRKKPWVPERRPDPPPLRSAAGGPQADRGGPAPRR
jgi:hypothetical protein